MKTSNEYKIPLLKDVPDCCGSCVHVSLLDYAAYCKQDHQQVCLFGHCKEFKFNFTILEIIE